MPRPPSLLSYRLRILPTRNRIPRSLRTLRHSSAGTLQIRQLFGQYFPRTLSVFAFARARAFRETLFQDCEGLIAVDCPKCEKQHSRSPGPLLERRNAAECAASRRSTASRRIRPRPVFGSFASFVTKIIQSFYRREFNSYKTLTIATLSDC